MSLAVLSQSKLFKFLTLLFFLLLSWIFSQIFKFEITTTRAFFAEFSPFLSGIIFVILYVLLTTVILFGPRDIFRIAAAIIFGAKTSTLFVWIAETINAVVSFYLSRLLGREFVKEKLKDKFTQAEGAKGKIRSLQVFTLRINPLIPFRVMDLGYGLSTISLKRYFFISLIASLPRIFWLQYIIAGAGEKILTSPLSLIPYLVENQFLIVYSALYFFAVIVLSIVAFLSFHPSK